jgi:hypothetical protein
MNAIIAATMMMTMAGAITAAILARAAGTIIAPAATRTRSSFTAATMVTGAPTADPESSSASTNQRLRPGSGALEVWLFRPCLLTASGSATDKRHSPLTALSDVVKGKGAEVGSPLTADRSLLTAHR